MQEPEEAAAQVQVRMPRLYSSPGPPASMRGEPRCCNQQVAYRDGLFLLIHKQVQSPGPQTQERAELQCGEQRLVVDIRRAGRETIHGTRRIH